MNKIQYSAITGYYYMGVVFISYNRADIIDCLLFMVIDLYSLNYVQ